MKNLKRSILVLALALTAAAGFVVRAYVNTAPRGPAFTFKGQLSTGARTFDVTTFYGADGSKRTLQESGELRRESVFVPGRGLFARKGAEWIRNEKAGVNAPPVLSEVEQESQVKASGQVVRREDVLGFTGYVSRIDEGEGAYTELTTVPALGAHVVRVVSVDATGNETSRLEPLSITLGEPSRADLRGDFK